MEQINLLKFAGRSAQQIGRFFERFERIFWQFYITVCADGGGHRGAYRVGTEPKLDEPGIKYITQAFKFKDCTAH
jgi:hypothetical protein